jgi:hypothetical protein
MREVMERGIGMVKESLIMDPRKIKEPMYLVGKIGGKEIRVIAKEGSVVLEGLDEVEEKSIELKQEIKAEVKDNGKPSEQILQGDKLGRENKMRDGSDSKEKEGMGDMQGDEYIKGNVPGMEEKSDRRDGEGAIDGGEGQETEGLREG